MMTADNNTVNTVTVISKLRMIDGLDVDSALARVSDKTDVYEKVLGMTARLIPDRIGNMDEYISCGDLKKFEIVVHGLRGVLANIGASALGNRAARLEIAAKTEDEDVCDKEYPDFRAALLEFVEKINAVVIQRATAPKARLAKDKFAVTLKGAKLAAESYDAMNALDIIKALSGYAYTSEMEKALNRAVYALEEFDCISALAHIIKMEEFLNELG